MNKTVLMLVFNNFKNDSRVLKECFTLEKSGYNVKVVALHESGLEEYEEYSTNISVHRVKLASRKLPKSLPFQVIKYFELVYQIIKRYKGIDIVHCNDISPLPVAVLLKKVYPKKNIKIVYDAHEYQIETQKLKGKKIRKYLTFITEKSLIKKVDGVITVSEGIAKEYGRIYNIPQPVLVLNTPNLKEVEKTNKFREIFNISESSKIALYQGAISEGRGIDILISAYKKIAPKDLVIVFMGMGAMVEKVKHEMKENQGIYYLDAVPPDQIMEYTSSADIGISLIEDSCLNYYYCLPNKMFEYAMAGLPLLVSNLPEMKKIVTKYNAGIVIESFKEEDIVEGLKKISSSDLAELSSNSKKVSHDYNWELQERKLMKIYNQFN
jgi:glycosyltransferase involved in cell wall biosynthesis